MTMRVIDAKKDDYIPHPPSFLFARFLRYRINSVLYPGG